MQIMKKKERIKSLEFQLRCLDSSHEDLIHDYIKEQIKNNKLRDKVELYQFFIFGIFMISLAIIPILVCKF